MLLLKFVKDGQAVTGSFFLHRVNLWKLTGMGEGYTSVAIVEIENYKSVKKGYNYQDSPSKKVQHFLDAILKDEKDTLVEYTKYLNDKRNFVATSQVDVDDAVMNCAADECEIWTDKDFKILSVHNNININDFNNMLIKDIVKILKGGY